MIVTYALYTFVVCTVLAFGFYRWAKAEADKHPVDYFSDEVFWPGLLGIVCAVVAVVALIVAITAWAVT